MSDPGRPWPTLLAEHRDLRERLLAAYAEPHRGYHNLEHLTEVLDRVRLLDGDDTVRLAAWFHDAVYDERGDNEERSAVLAETELAARGVPPDTVAEVARLVRLTATHAVGDDDRNGAILCDADLAILAADDARYREYVAGVRREYAHVPDDAFRAGRTQVLERLAQLPSLFHTDHGRTHWERPARANIARELEELRSP